jgi:ABC-type nitrate/sulfonate/bicarbonate transport system substrate-binding protein
MRISSILGRLLLGAASLAIAGAASAEPLQTVNFGLSSNSLGAASFRIAKELGLFEKHGLEPKFSAMDTAAAVTAALISGSVQVATAAIGELVAAQARGQPVVEVTNSYGGLSGTMVLSKAVADKLGVSPNAPIDQRLKALNGLVIASTAGTSINTTAYQAAANRVGAKYRATFMAQDAMPAALDSGAVQGFVSAAPYWSLPITKGTGVLWISGPKGELPADLTPSTSNFLMVLRPYAEAHPDLIKRIDAVYQDFIKALNERPDAVEAVIAKLFPSLDKPTVDMLFGMESYAWKAKKLTVDDMRKDIGFLKASGANVPNIDRIDPASLLWTIK